MKENKVKLPEEFKLLLKLSKEDIIILLCEKNFLIKPPTKKDILWLQWEKASEAASKESKRLLAKGDRLLKLAKEHDEYARLLNASDDTNEKLRLLDKMKPYYKAFENDRKEWEAQQRLQNKADKIYKQWEKENA